MHQRLYCKYYVGNKAIGKSQRQSSKVQPPSILEEAFKGYDRPFDLDVCSSLKVKLYIIYFSTMNFKTHNLHFSVQVSEDNGHISSNTHQRKSSIKKFARPHRI